MLKFPDVFGEGLGQLDGQYKIRLDETVPPVQHAPRRIAVALRPQLKDTLDALEAQGIIAQVTTPTRWISSIVAVPKKNGKLRICLDPKDLYRAIQREKYQLPTVEDIATRLHGAKVFTVMDVRNGFWHVSLDEVLFIGHMATDKGLEVDPAKVRAISEMPAPTDKLGVQQLPGTGPVPHQVPSLPFGRHQAIKGLNAV